MWRTSVSGMLSAVKWLPKHFKHPLMQTIYVVPAYSSQRKHAETVKVLPWSWSNCALDLCKPARQFQKKNLIVFFCRLCTLIKSRQLYYLASHFENNCTHGILCTQNWSSFALQGPEMCHFVLAIGLLLLKAAY